MEEDSPKKVESFADIAKDADLANSDSEAAKPLTVEEAAEKASNESEPVKPKVKHAWIDFKAINLSQDLQNILRSPFWIIMNLLMVLILVLFLLLFSDYLKQDQHDKLIGYVATNRKIPEWHTGELPPEAKEILHLHHEKRKKLAEARKLIKDDPRMQQAVMGDFYPEELTNNDVTLILESQDIGVITRAGAVKTELMNLSGLNLSKISFDEMNNFLQSDLRYTNFEGISHIGLEFRGASAEFAQFVDARIAEANFTRARLDSSNFYGASSPESLFISAIGPRSQMSDANFSGAKFDDSIFKLADFSRSNLSKISAKEAHFEGASFRDANLEGANFKYSNLRGVNFVNANLRGANFSKTSLEGANFEGADIKGAKFNDADLTQANFLKVKNAERKQFESSKTKVGINNIPSYVYPQQRSYRTRFNPPRTPGR